MTNSDSSSSTSPKFDLGSFSSLDNNNSNSSATAHRPPSTRDSFSWRLDPEVSFSDWTIELEIIEQPEEEEENLVDSINLEQQQPDGHGEQQNNDDDDGDTVQLTFHVHRCILGAGPRHSAYFHRVFHHSSSMIRESIDSTSKIRVEYQTALAFPRMLDYMYAKDDEPLHLTTQDAVPLRWLSTYFGIEPMFREASEFIQEDLSIETAPTYMRRAEIYHDDKIVRAASEVCAKHLQHLDVRGEMIRLSTHHFSLVMEQAKKQQHLSSELLSRRVATYCNFRSDDVTAEMLSEWTDPEFMDQIEPSHAAISLLRHAEDHGWLRCSSTDEGVAHEGQTEKISLKHRCIDSASSNWPSSLIECIRRCQQLTMSEEEDDSPDDHPAFHYSHLAYETKCLLLENALLDANDRLTKIQDQLNSANRRLETMDCRLESLEEEYDDLEDTYLAAKSVLRRLKRVEDSPRVFATRKSETDSHTSRVPDLREFDLTTAADAGLCCQVRSSTNTLHWCPIFYYTDHL